MATIMINEPELEDFAADAGSVAGDSSATLGLLFEIETSTVVRNAHGMPTWEKFCRLGTNCMLK
jgi:hypothetical protein